MKDFLAIGYILSLMLFLLCFFMIVVSLADFIALSYHGSVFGFSAAITFAFAFALFFLCRRQRIVLDARLGLILTGSTWFFMTFFATLPFLISPFGLNFTDGFFEAMSGLTTTGATVITDLDNLPAGLLLWRSLLQWLGGIGIVFTAIAILPLLKVGGMELFPLQSSEQSDKATSLPAVRNISTSIFIVYLFLSVICMLCYIIAGMSFFDALNHAMTTIAIGGFSTHNSSLGYFDNRFIIVVSIIFMIMASLPFMYYVTIFYRNWRVISYATQPKVFIGILVCAICLIFFTSPLQHSFDNLLTIIFNTTSVMSGTGYSSTDYNSWGSFSTLIFFLLMFTGGCAGSAACGVKIFRLEVSFQGILRAMWQRLYPNGVFPTRYNNRPLPPDVEHSVFAFLVIYLACFILVFLLLQLNGLDVVTAASASASALSNLGPGLGNIVGPAGHYAELSAVIKWILALTMLVGRLEIIPIFGIFLYLFGRQN